jgi:anti-anti-sigma factor
MADRFDIDVSHDPTGRVCVVALAGKLDPDGAAALDPELDALVAAGDRRFVLDLAGLRYVGSLGLRSLVGLANRVRGEGTVVLCAPPAPVRQVLEMTRITTLLRVYPSRADAIDAARSH